MAEDNSQKIEERIEGRRIFIKNLNKFFSDYFNWIVAGIVMVVFFSGFFILLLPRYQQAASYLEISNQQQTLNVSAEHVKLNKIQKLLAAYNSIDKNYLAILNEIAPVVQNKEELFSELNYLISANQLFLTSVSLSAGNSYADQGLVPISGAQGAIVGSLQTVKIDIGVRGTNYQTFKNLLSSLENNLRLMDVLSVTFNPQSQDTTLTIDAYYSKN